MQQTQDAANRAAFDKAAIEYAERFGALSEASRRLVDTANTAGDSALFLMGDKPEFNGAYEFVEQLRRGVADVRNAVPEPSAGPAGVDTGF